MEESMKDYEKELEKSFQVIKEGDILNAQVIGISDTEVMVDIDYYTEGVIPLEECSNDPGFSIKNDLSIGDTIQVMVIDAESTTDRVILSLKQANDILVWDELKEDYEDGTVFNVKITEAVPSGVVGYVKGIRAFIPASQLALSYVEDTESYVGKKVDAVIITVEAKERRLVLSAKMIEKERAAAEQLKSIGRLSVGDIVKGPVKRIESYGVFIDIGEGLMGLCHISQITNRFLKSPKEVLKMGEEVQAKILKIEGERISLSIKALREDEEPEKTEDDSAILEEYQKSVAKEEEETESPFAKLLKGIDLS